LLATISLGNEAALGPLRAFVAEVKPDAQQALSGPALTPKLANAVSAGSLDGLDETSPRYVLWFDDRAAQGLALVGKFKDPQALAANLGRATSMAKGQWAVVGAPAVVAKIGRYALDEFASGSEGASAAISVYLPQLLNRYRNDIESARKQLSDGYKAMANGAQMAPLLDGYVNGILSMLQDSDLALVTFRGDKALGGIDIALVPRQNTRLKTFVGLQEPSEFKLLQRLPAAPWMVFAEGRFTSGPYRQGLMEMVAAMYSQADGHAMMALLNVAMAAATGDFAFAGQFSFGKGMEILQLFQVADANAITTAVDQFTAWLGAGKTMMQMNIKTTLVPAKPASIGGTHVRGYDMTYDVSEVPEAQRTTMNLMMPGGFGARLAMVDKLAVVAMSNDPSAGIAKGIAAAGGKTSGFTAAGPAVALLHTARQNQDSLAFVMDVGAVLGKTAMPFMMSLGFVGANAHIRVTVPSSVLASIIR